MAIVFVSNTGPLSLFPGGTALAFYLSPFLGADPVDD